MNDATPFLVTSEYRRFAEFCDACRHYRYIGLCYGPPGVGKTLSARHYADWDRFEALPSAWQADDETLAAFAGADTVLYTPEIVNSPSTVANGVRSLRTSLGSIQQEPQRRTDQAAARVRTREEDRRSREFLLEGDWFTPPPGRSRHRGSSPSPWFRGSSLAPAWLILVDEADRLQVASLEQLRDLIDRNEVGLVLIGMPGIEKRFARYPQLYSRVGFVHAFRALRAEEIRRLLAEHGPAIGLTPPTSDISDQEAIAAIIRITGGNFRLLRRPLSQIERILRINQLQAITAAVVEAARESLVIDGMTLSALRRPAVVALSGGKGRDWWKGWVGGGGGGGVGPGGSRAGASGWRSEGPIAGRGLRAVRRRAGRLETRPARSLPAAPDRNSSDARETRRRFRSLTEAIDTTTPGGRLVFHLLERWASSSVI